jgi:hypothetical protein
LTESGVKAKVNPFDKNIRNFGGMIAGLLLLTWHFLTVDSLVEQQGRGVNFFTLFSCIIGIPGAVVGIIFIVNIVRRPKIKFDDFGRANGAIQIIATWHGGKTTPLTNPCILFEEAGCYVFYTIDTVTLAESNRSRVYLIDPPYPDCQIIGIGMKDYRGHYHYSKGFPKKFKVKIKNGAHQQWTCGCTDCVAFRESAGGGGNDS